MPIINSGGKIEITIEREKPTETAVSIFGKPRRGILSREIEDDYLKRRLKKTGKINFYTLQVRRDENDNFNEILFHRAHGIELNDSNQIVQLPPTVADFEALKEEILSVPLPELKNKYLKLDYDNAYRYGLIVYEGQEITSIEEITLHPDNPHWTTEGYDLTDKMWIFNGAFENLNFREEGFTKVTRTSNPNDEHVDLGDFRNGNIYLMPRLCRLEGFAQSGGDPRQFIGSYYNLISNELLLNIDQVNFAETPKIARPVFLPIAMLNFFSTNNSLVTIYPPFDYGSNTWGKFLNPILSKWSESPEKYHAFVNEAEEIVDLPFDEFPPTASFGCLYYSSAASALEPTTGYILAAIIETGGEFYYAWSILETYQRMDWGFEFQFISGGGGENPELPGAPIINPLKYYRNLSSPTGVKVYGENITAYTGVSWIELQIQSESGTPLRRKLKYSLPDLNGSPEEYEFVLQVGVHYTSENIIKINKNENFNKYAFNVQIADDYGMGFGAFAEIELKFLVSINTSFNNDTMYIAYSTAETIFASGSYPNGNWTFALVGGEVEGYPG